MAALAEWIAGAYDGTYNAVAIGVTEQGFDLEQSVKQEVIDESDAYGNTILDYIYRGGDCKIVCDSKEYKAGSYAPYWPWGALGVHSTASAPIGRLASSVASALVLTSKANTPAASKPASLTATYSILSPGQAGRLTFNSKLRRVPISLQLLPYDVSGTLKWFALT
jgi:hypothetical protein